MVEGFKYDANGNIIFRSTPSSERKLYWDESNRLRVVADENGLQHYIYDASGERVLKANTSMEQLFENGTLATEGSAISIHGYTSYPSAYIVITADGVYSKHYYAGSQRIVSRIGEQDAGIFEIGCTDCRTTPSEIPFDDALLKAAQTADLNFYAQKATSLKLTLKEFKKIVIDQKTDSIEGEGHTPPSGAGGLYYYHPDHLGTSTTLTDYFGKAYQFFLNLHFGETMVQQLGNNYYNSPFNFNGKELDEETGFYYYGARYYDPRVSIWMSVDPLAEKFPNFNPYNYVMQNPINLTDPSGLEPEEGGNSSCWEKLKVINYTTLN